MKANTSVSIGIVAYNERDNIGFLIKALINQENTNFYLSQIVVISDGSTDGTAKAVKEMSNEKILLLEDSNRLGLGRRQQQVARLVSSSVLVLLNADVAIKDKNFIERLIRPIIKDGIDLTSAELEELPPTTEFEKIILSGMRFKKRAFSRWRLGNNAFTCHGTGRAFSKKLYQSIGFPVSIGEDLYSYLFTVTNGFNYRFVPNAKVYYRLPSSMEDHKKQSFRFFKALALQALHFDPLFIKEQTAIPLYLWFISGLSEFIRSPFRFSLYLLTVGYLYLKNRKIKYEFDNDCWPVATSSKRLREELT